MRYQLNTSSEILKALIKAGLDLKSAQMGKCFTFMKSFEQSKLEATLKQTIYKSAMKIQTVARKINRKRIYSPLIACFRSFYQAFDSVQLQEVRAFNIQHHFLNLHLTSIFFCDCRLKRVMPVLKTSTQDSLELWATLHYFTSKRKWTLI